MTNNLGVGADWADGHEETQVQASPSAAPVEQVVERRTYSEVRLAPSSVEAEEAVLGSVLIDPASLMFRLAQVLRPDHFFIVKNRWVWESFCSLHSRSQPIDFLTVCHELETQGRLADLDGPAYLSHLSASVPTAIHGVGYAEIVMRAALRRGLLGAASDIAQLAYDETESDLDAIMAQAMSKVRKVSADRVGKQASTSEQVVSRLLDKIKFWHDNPLQPGEVRGISAGMEDLDKLWAGFQRGELGIIAGRPGMAKSTLLFQIGFNAAVLGNRVFIASIEMQDTAVYLRRVCADLQIARDVVMGGHMNEEEYAAVVVHLNDLACLPIVIEDKRGMTTSMLERIYVEQGPFDLSLIDHLGLFTDPKPVGVTDAKHVGNICKGIRRMAYDYNHATIAACQLNRGVEMRSDKHPMLSDLRDSGEIEEHADWVTMLYREDYYDPQSERRNILELMSAKVREGMQNALVEVYFDRFHTCVKQLKLRTMDLNAPAMAQPPEPYVRESYETQVYDR